MTDQQTIDEIRARLKLNLPFISASGCDYSVNEADYIEALTDCNWLLTALDEARRENERLRALVGEMREDIMSWLKHSENLDVDIYEVPSTVFRTPEEELHSNELIHRADAAIAEQRELTGEKG